MKADHIRISTGIAPKDVTTTHGVSFHRSAIKRQTRRLERRILNANLRELLCELHLGVPSVASAFRAPPALASFF